MILVSQLLWSLDLVKNWLNTGLAVVFIVTKSSGQYLFVKGATLPSSGIKFHYIYFIVNAKQ